MSHFKKSEYCLVFFARALCSLGFNSFGLDFLTPLSNLLPATLLLLVGSCQKATKTNDMQGLFKK